MFPSSSTLSKFIQRLARFNTPTGLSDEICVFSTHVLDYPTDISPFPEQPGRICAKSCDGVVCGLGQMCQPVAESPPVCTCPGK